MRTHYIFMMLLLICVTTLTGFSQTVFLPLTVSDGDNEITLTIGVHAYGGDDFVEGLDIPLPPPPPAGAFDARLRWEGEDYARDIRNSIDNEFVFDMLYSASSGGGPITLTWNPDHLDELGKVEIVDQITGELWGPFNMSETGELDVSETDGVLDDGLQIRISLTIPEPDTRIEEILNEGDGVDFNVGETGVTFSADVTAEGEVTALLWEDMVPLVGTLPNGIESILPIAVSVSTLEMEFTGGVISIPVASLTEISEDIDPAELAWLKREHILDGWESIGGDVIDDRFVSTVPFDGLSDFGIGSEIPLSTGDKITGIPRAYSLYQNYPNPFNPATTIRFALPESGEVRIVVYDLLGREITTLVDDYVNAGYHEVVFEAVDISSGIYVYRIHAGEYVETMRLMLLK